MPNVERTADGLLIHLNIPVPGHLAKAAAGAPAASTASEVIRSAAAGESDPRQAAAVAMELSRAALAAAYQQIAPEAPGVAWAPVETPGRADPRQVARTALLKALDRRRAALDEIEDPVERARASCESDMTVLAAVFGQGAR